MADTAPSLPQRRSVMWFKSSYSGGEGNECVEVADRGSWAGVRDSKSPRKTLALSKDAFTAFVAHLPKARPGVSHPWRSAGAEGARVRRSVCHALTRLTSDCGPPDARPDTVNSTS